MSACVFVLMTDCAGLLMCLHEDHRTELQLWDDPWMRSCRPPGAQPPKWVPALSVGALCNSILLAHTNSVSRSNEIFKGAL